MPADAMPTDDASSTDISAYLDDDFSAAGYGSRYIVLNLGSMYLITIATIFFAIVLVATRKCVIWNKRLREWHSKQEKGMFWNTFIRVVLESYLEFSLGAFYELRIQRDMMKNGDFTEAAQTGFAFWWIDIISQAVIILALLALPIFILSFYLKKFDLWGDEDFDEKFGSPLGDLRKN